MKLTHLDVALKEARSRFGPQAVVTFDVIRQVWAVLVLDHPQPGKFPRIGGVYAMQHPPRRTIAELVQDMCGVPRLAQPVDQTLANFHPPIGAREQKA